jgi:hypothetical protein
MMLRAGSGSAAFTKRSVRCAFILPSAPTEARSISTGKMLSVEGGVLGGNGLKEEETLKTNQALSDIGNGFPEGFGCFGQAMYWPK